MKIVLIVCYMAVALLSAENLKPSFSLQTSGNVQAMVHQNNLLYAATSNGSVEIFNLLTKTLVRSIKIPPIKDFMGDTIPSKIYSLDVHNKKIVFISEGTRGYRNLWIEENATVKKLIDVNRKWFMRKVMFVDETHLLIALLSNELILFDTAANKVVYNKQISASSFSDFMLSEDKTTYATTDESGVVHVVETQTAAIIKRLEGQNLDKVYQLDYKQGVILTAGQDRRCVVYENDGSASYMLFHFLLYSCALSPSASLSAVAYNEENDILIFKTHTKAKRYNLVGQNATLTQILFLDEGRVAASSESQTINFWILK